MSTEPIQFHAQNDKKPTPTARTGIGGVKILAASVVAAAVMGFAGGFAGSYLHTGPRGAQGAAGTPGPQGQEGPQGPAGPAGKASQVDIGNMTCQIPMSDLTLVTDADGNQAWGLRAGFHSFPLNCF